MKNYKKLIIIIPVVIIVSIVAFLAFFIVQENIEYRKMTPLNTQEIIPDVYAVNNGNVNLYLIKNNEGYIAIDAGSSPNVTKRELDKLGINPDDVTMVFLTHTDMDHVASVKLFKNAKIYISEEEKQMITGETKRKLIFGNKLDCEYSTLKDGEKINSSNTEIQCILTPGHTIGSACYIVNGELLFSGDTISLKVGTVDTFNKPLNMDTEAQKDSINKLKQLTNIKYIFTGHYGYSDNFEKAFKEN